MRLNNNYKPLLELINESIKLLRGCGHFLGLVMQPSQGSVGTPKDSYFQVMF